MKILHLLHQYLPEKLAGTELYSKSAPLLSSSAQGYEVAIFYPCQPACWPGDLAPTVEEGVRVYRAPSEPRSATQVFPKHLASEIVRHLSHVLRHENTDSSTSNTSWACRACGAAHGSDSDGGGHCTTIGMCAPTPNCSPIMMKRCATGRVAGELCAVRPPSAPPTPTPCRSSSPSCRSWLIVICALNPLAESASPHRPHGLSPAKSMPKWASPRSAPRLCRTASTAGATANTGRPRKG